MKSLYLIRHGLTRANLEHLYCGSTDLPLSETGIFQLQQLHYCLPEQVRYLTSGMKRTEQTLEILFGTVPHRGEPAFREVDFGIFEMQSYEQLQDQPAYQTWISGDNERNIPPEGESGLQMRSRVLPALENLLRQQEDTVLVTHGGVIAMIMESFFPGEGKNRYQWQPEPGHGYMLSGGSYRMLP